MFSAGASVVYNMLITNRGGGHIPEPKEPKPPKAWHWILFTIALVGTIVAVATANAAQAAGPGVYDNAGLFSESAREKANQRIQGSSDLIIETIESADAPFDQAAKQRFFDQLLNEKASRRGATGVFVLICKKPGRVQVNAERSNLSADVIRDAALAKLKKKDFDGALAAIVDIVANRPFPAPGPQAAPEIPRAAPNQEPVRPVQPQNPVAAPEPVVANEEGHAMFWLFFWIIVVILIIWFFCWLFRSASRGGYGYGGGGYGGGGGGFNYTNVDMSSHSSGGGGSSGSGGYSESRGGSSSRSESSDSGGSSWSSGWSSSGGDYGGSSGGDYGGSSGGDCGGSSGGDF